MPQVIKSLKLFTNEVKLEILHQSREKFKAGFYGHSFHRGSNNLSKLVPSESEVDNSEISLKSSSSSAR